MSPRNSTLVMATVIALLLATITLLSVRSKTEGSDPSPWLVISTTGGPVYGRFSRSPCKLNKLVPNGARLAQLTDIRTVPNPGPDGLFRAIPQPDACLSISAIVSVSTVDPKTPLGRILDSPGPMTAAQLGVRLPPARVAQAPAPAVPPPVSGATKPATSRRK